MNDVKLTNTKEQDNCLFCKIVKNEVNSEKVYEDDEIMAFLDIRPTNIGHTLVIPKNHFKNLHETPDDMVGKLFITSKKIAGAIKHVVKADGINILNNNEPAAGQIIFHIHIHIVPRFDNDGFKHWTGKKTYIKDEMVEIAHKIKSIIHI